MFIFIAWLRRNCMSVFHYCASRLAGTPLFESCSDQDLVTKDHSGAIYNDFDGLNSSLLSEQDFESSQIEYSNDVNVENGSPVEQRDLDMCFLQADDDDVARWEIDSEFFDCYNLPSSLPYIEKVHHLVENEDELDILYDDHIQR